MDNPVKQGNVVPQWLNSDFFRQLMVQAVTTGFQVGSLITVAAPTNWEQSGKEWLVLFCTAMVAKITVASAVNGTITAGKVH